MKVWLFLFLIFLIGCSQVQDASEIPLSQIEESGLIHFDDVAEDTGPFEYESLKLYDITDDKLVESLGKEFHPGQSFGFVVLHLKGLTKDPEGKVWYDVDMKVEDSSKNPVLFYEGLLGENGNVKLAKDVISVYGNISIPPAASPGEYSLTITVHDKIAQKTFVKTTGFMVN